MTSEKYAGKTPLFAGIDSVKFRRKIVPGDTVYAKAIIAQENEEKGVITCSAELYLDGEIAVRGLITIAMR
jgi:3-hydroxyacyl-[acyl-carrier-protein] dehydratase